MFTSRGYRQRSKENRKKSEYGQIIQRKPVFQIDNNPYVLDAYKQYILSTMPRMLRTQFDTDTHEITLSEFSISWSQSTALLTIKAALISFASDIFNQYKEQGKYPISLELYAPNLYDDYEWYLLNKESSKKAAIGFSHIIIDSKGTFSWVFQYLVGYGYDTFLDYDNSTLAIGLSVDHLTYSNPTKMKINVNYFTFYNGN